MAEPIPVSGFEALRGRLIRATYEGLTGAIGGWRASPAFTGRQTLRSPQGSGWDAPADDAPGVHVGDEGGVGEPGLRGDVGDASTTRR